MNSANQTSVAAAQPEITAPVRLEGQSNSEVLFTWLLVNRYLWMLDTKHDAELERIVGGRARLRLGYKLIEWRRSQPNNGEGHAALVAPKDGGVDRQRSHASRDLSKSTSLGMTRLTLNLRIDQAGGIELRQMIEIQEQDLPRIAELAGELRKEVIRLIAEIRRDHWNIDETEAWAIAFGRMPSFVAFSVKSHLHVIVEELLPDLVSNLREAATVTDDALVKEWQELWQEAWQPREGAIH